MIDKLNNSSEIFDFFKKLLYQMNSSESLIADTFSIFSHLARKSEEVINTIIKILKGPQDNFSILFVCFNGSSLIKSRCCNMIGNLMKHNDSFYEVLRANKEIFQLLVVCCKAEELNIRKVKDLNFKRGFM